MLIMGQGTDDYILVMFWITIWIQDFFLRILAVRTGFYTYVAPLVCGASAVSRTPKLLGGGLRSPSAFLVAYDLFWFLSEAHWI